MRSADAVQRRLAGGTELLAALEKIMAEAAAERGSAIIEELPGRVGPMLAAAGDEMVAEAALGLLATFPVPEVRAAGVAVAAGWLPAGFAVDVLFTLTTDPDDIVCLAAIQQVGEHRIDHLGRYVLDIIGRPSAAAHSSVSPVGRGAAYGVAAIQGLLGATDQRALEAAEADFLRHGATPERLSWAPATGRADIEALPLPPEDGMVMVPGGRSEHGLPGEAVPDHRFDWRRAVPARPLWLPPFLIDRYPVSNADYDEFTAAVRDADHAWCHALEPRGKVHERNTRADHRVGLDHPATGIDWYDAFSYARWQGKSLPTEYQWEKAARGPAGTVWSWGDEWDPAACTWFGSVFGRPEADLSELRAVLATTSRSVPAATTTPVHTYADRASGYGMVDGSGNCWEWTRSELRTGRHFSPSVALRSDGPCSVVLKGGAWSSLPGQLFPSFRGQDAATCRHDEIGFRCVRQPPFPRLRAAAGGAPLHNTALY